MRLLRRLGWCLLLLPVVPHGIQAQMPYPPSADPGNRGAFPQRDPFSPFGGRSSPQLPMPPNGSTAEWEQHRKQALAERERILLVRCKGFVQFAMREDKQRVSLALKDHQRLEGFIHSATPEQFVIENPSTQQEYSVRYEEVAKWRVIRSPGAQARSNGQTIGLVLLAIPLLPFMLLAGLAGWDGC
jgi:hypothetical protein